MKSTVQLLSVPFGACYARAWEYLTNLAVHDMKPYALWSDREN